MTPPFLKASNLDACRSIAHGFFTREGGVSMGPYASLNGGLQVGDDPLFVRENRRRVCVALEVPQATFLSCRQIHSCDVVAASEPWRSVSSPKADALVSKRRGVVLGILTADCAPILFADEEAGVIGAAHAGWRGALSGVAEQTVLMMERLGAKRSAIRAAVGPCIGPASYEVSADFLRPFLDQDEENARFFENIPDKDDKRLFDLPAYVASRLEALGLASVEGSPADTFPDRKTFFSYRRDALGIEKNSGRQISAIALR